jgi:4-azaleucine resistance transporter AzlC
VSVAQASFTRAGVWRGFVQAQPLAPGVALYGLVFGVLASERGLHWLQATLMSVFVYSGSAQLAALQVWSAGTALAIAPLVVTVLAVNARYVLYGASVQPWLSAGATRTQALGSLFVLGDGSWALAMRAHAAGDRDAGFLLGTGLAGILPWVGGTLAGHAFTSGIPDPRVLGLDFMLPAFAAAIGIALWRGRADLLPLAAAAAVALPLQAGAPSGWTIVAAGVAAGAAGVWRHGR